LAVAAAAEALKEWRDTPVMKRVQPLYKMKQLLEENIDEIARLITLECGKSFIESKAEMQRAIENVETACGTPILIQSEFSENVAPGIDEFMIRQAVGVCAIISPFNFPGNDSVLVFTLCNCLWKQCCCKTFRKSSFNHDEGF
jgi:malonate-semialdehyde dehydrogenase (acetylating) / methylmalonate-semialdehyde dehydrogenase